MLIQIFLLFAFAFFTIYFVNNFNKVKLKAWKRIAFTAFILFGIASVINPGLIDKVAKTLGIGRGADLLLYSLVVTFLFVTINFYIRFRELSLRQDKIVSKIALLEKGKEIEDDRS